MPVFKNSASLQKHLQATINKALQNNVANTVRETQQKNIKETVYDVYDPKMYERRLESGGLMDENNIKSTLVEDGVLKVKNVTPVNPIKKKDLVGYRPSDGESGDEYFNNAFPSEYGLAEIVEYGNAGKSVIHNPARPFTENTVNDLKNSKAHITALKKGLLAQGVGVK